MLANPNSQTGSRYKVNQNECFNQQGAVDL